MKKINKNKKIQPTRRLQSPGTEEPKENERN
jgi:hypothetical protein